MKFLLIVLTIFFSWVVFDFDYDMQDANSSLERMAKWSPISAKNLFQDFEIASDDAFASNLDGLNVDQIHEIAVERRIALYKKQIELIPVIIEDITASGKNSIALNDDFTKPEAGFVVKNFTVQDLENAVFILRAQLSMAEKDANSFFNFRSFPRSMKDIFLIFNFWRSILSNVL
jgi:hypothetical protein